MSPEPTCTDRGAGPASVTALLRDRLASDPDGLAYRFITGIDGRSESWSHRELDRRARAVAARLQDAKLDGRPVLLLHPPGLDYIANFLGCLYAGAIAVPAYPPDTSRFGQTFPRLAAIARDARATHALTTDSVRDFVANQERELENLGLANLTWLGSGTSADPTGDGWHDPGTTGGTLAFLQYTSGSTSTPKGVMVSHDNLLANLRSIHQRLRHDRDSAMALWLPPYHDMGLIGGILTALYSGIPLHFMAPMTFVQRPLLWLETISQTRASTAIAPNFGFEHCLTRVSPEERDSLDLSHWRLALNGAEPVRADTLDRFAEFFAPSGFDRRAFMPCYGLAEATLLVSGTRADEPPAVGSFATQALEAGAPEPAGPGTDRVTRIVGCGPAADGVSVEIVDPAVRRRVPAGRTGEIWVSGPGVARGYWRKPEATRETFHAEIDGEPGARYLRTGDLGFLHAGQLHIVGRTKDVVIVQGRNHYPHDIELTVEKADPAIRANCGAVFGIPTGNGEALVVAYEVDGRKLGDPAALLARLRTAIAQEHEVSPHAVVLLKRSTVHRTTSGKIQRGACRTDFLRFGLTAVAASVVSDSDGPVGTGGPSAGRGRATVAEAVDDVLTGITGATRISGRGFADIGLDYPRLTEAVRLLGQRLGVEVPLGDLLVCPDVDTLTALLLGDTPADSPSTTTEPSPRAVDDIEAWLTAKIAGRLGLATGTIDATRPFASLGLDSRQAVAICDDLGTWLGRTLLPGVVFDHPTIRAVATALGTTTPLTPGDAPEAATARPAGGNEPIAIVGIGCRFPGAPDADSYWQLLLDGRDAITEVPADRWDTTVVKAPRLGGFIDHIDEFDARFFGISAREAERMDPQQRLLLETAWHTIEDAGIAPSALAGSDTGVFVGISSHDYSGLQLSDPLTTDIHAATGNAHAIAANRLSYTLDLRGPSIALDTACSSSLVAVHAACQSLRSGECHIALAGGVNLLITPALSVAFSEGGMLSATGRCRTFDDAADGYVRGEGVGLVCLKPLAAAIADGDRIHATITGSGLGHGGRSNGLTAPRGSAQRTVIERALGQAGSHGAEIDYVEAHGTGTSLGDPVEWEALVAAYGRHQEHDRPCLVGSAKSNIGHLEAAAGIAGLIKAAFVVRHREVPPQLHFTTPNRRLAREGSGLEVPTRRRALPAGSVARAAVSSFGFGGMNAHVVLEAPPTPVAPAAPPERSPRTADALCLSAHSPTALAELARRYRGHLVAHPDVPTGALCHAANTGRSHLPYRAVVNGRNSAELDEGLAALSQGAANTQLVVGHASHGPAPRTAFLFSGQGTQYAGMGKQLYDSHEGVARSLDRSDRVLRPLLGIPLTELLFEESGADRLRSTRYCQPALVALEIALAELWISVGVRPAALLGHSVGAYSVACVAGVLSQEDALTLTATRARHMDEQPGDGSMIACSGDPATILELAAAHPPVSVAAVNAPGQLVLSGPADRIHEVRAELEARSVAVRPLTVSHAFHSPMMEGAADPLRAAARELDPSKPRIPWVSDVTGEPVDHVDDDYWVDHLLGTVRFADGVATLRRLGCDTFVEIGPHPALLGLTRAADPGNGPVAVLRLPSLRRGADDWKTFLQSLARLHCAGGDVDWAALEQGSPPARVSVPRTVFERQPYWFTAPEPTTRDLGVPAQQPNGFVQERREHDMNGMNGMDGSGTDWQPTWNGHDGPQPVVQRDVVGWVSQVCGFPTDQIPVQARLGMDLGFDSLMKTELQRHIAQKYPHRLGDLRRSLPDDPTVQDLVGVLGAGQAVLASTPQYLPAPQQYAQVPQQYTAPPSAPPQPAPTPELAAPPVRVEREFEEWAEYAELQGRLRQIESSGANAYGRVHEGYNTGRISMDGREIVNFSAFNYLALSSHPRLRAAATAAIDHYGTSSSATPLLCGETPLHHELDAEIASFLGTDAAIVFAGGHATNVATVGHLFGPEDVILHDEWIHDSTVRGCILSGARRRPFPHNDWEALDRMLGALRRHHRRAVIVIEGAYSQDGDIPDLPRFIEVKKRHDAMLMIDEAHSIGVLGRTGRGIGEHFDVDRRDVDLWMGTLSKALGSLGGYIAARSPIIQYLKFTAPLYIFSTGISPANAAAALEAFRVIRDEPQRVRKAQELAEFFRDAARARGLDIGVSRASAVVPIILGSWERSMTISNRLLAQGVNVMPIGYPAVARDKCRLRFFINVDHRESDLEHSLDLLRHAMSSDSELPPPAPRTRAEPSASPAARRDADILVAGAGGFIGGHLTRRLVEQGHRVRVFVRENSDRSAFGDLPVEVEVGSLGNTDSLRRATDGVKQVYNCTGKSADWGPWEEFRHVNIEGGRNLVEAAHQAGTVERILHVSTTDVYGYPVRPCDESATPRDTGLPYNRSKLLGETVVRETAERLGIPLTVVRPVSVYGPRSKDFVIELANLIVQKQMVYIRRGNVPAGLLYVGNAVDAMIAACGSEATIGRAYNLRDPDLTTWREYMEALAEGLGVRPPSMSLPSAVATGVATVSEKVYGTLRIKSRPVLTRHAVHLFERDQSYPIERARNDFGFKSEVGFEEAMRRTIDWLDSAEGRRHVSR
ncbi:aminotransferase class I/II-fold pyridoxal phosphate-dependent enzyme [Streptomyces sp. So13.3]|uniref:type I polyketide synthase n=1 Tax=Streptomyces sp. So13.3 TaxID=2136173 RepID=UPI0011073102|nr:type I polyketide synthase [Streptomyces sp. So13.3]QNA71961.1 aminotransferase class I/II-fold pyridoxal phosphate-dependent enzyme [Streptomyces sp. So13.3]